MKHSAAPNSTNSFVSKRSKSSHSRPATAKPASHAKPVKYIPPPPLTAKQQKSFHWLLSGASYISVLEGSTLNIAGIREKCSKTYHGYDEDHVGMAENFLDGRGRFNVLWDSGRIASGYGHLTGISRESINEVLFKPTLKGKNLITGRQILDKAKAALCEAKKFLAYWMEFLVDGNMPSGMNEDSALQHVMKRAMEEQSLEVADDDESVGKLFLIP